MKYERIASREVRGVRDRPCIWCPETIPAGDKRIEHAYKMDGSFCYDQYHLECWEASQTVNWKEYGNVFDPHSFKRGTLEQA